MMIAAEIVIPLNDICHNIMITITRTDTTAMLIRKVIPEKDLIRTSAMVKTIETGIIITSRTGTTVKANTEN